MQTTAVIFPNEIQQTLAANQNQVSQLTLKDGTILKITPKTNLLSQNNFILRDKVTLIKRKHKNENLQKNTNDDGVHNHHQDGMGSFGQHFKTEYSPVCPDCTDGPGGVIKQRQNYILYVSKNVTEENLSNKRKKICNYENQQTNYQGNIIINKYDPNTQNKGEKVISRGYIEVNEIPTIKPNIRLRNQQITNNEMVCPDCTQAQNGENLCPDCNVDDENINEEKVTTTVKVLVPDNENYQ